MYCSYFLTFDYCRFRVVIRFFHPRQNGQWPPTLKDLCPRFYPLHFNPILTLQKEPVFPFSMLSAKQGNYWIHFYNVFGMTRSLTGDWTRTSRTRSQHSTTRLSRRSYLVLIHLKFPVTHYRLCILVFAKLHHPQTSPIIFVQQIMYLKSC